MRIEYLESLKIDFFHQILILSQEMCCVISRRWDKLNLALLVSNLASNFAIDPDIPKNIAQWDRGIILQY